jgi:hypothetical protein
MGREAHPLYWVTHGLTHGFERGRRLF